MSGWKTSSHLVDDPLLGLRLAALLTEKVGEVGEMGEMGEAKMKDISYGDLGKGMSTRESTYTVSLSPSQLGSGAVRQSDLSS